MAKNVSAKKVTKKRVKKNVERPIFSHLSTIQLLR